MRGEKLLAAFLLTVSLCFVPVLGYGEVQKWVYEEKRPVIDVYLLEVKIDYIYHNLNTFLNVALFYDPDGRFGDFLPEGTDTKGKIFIMVYDIRGVFAYKSGTALLDQFKKELELICSSITRFSTDICTDMDSDIIAVFYVPSLYSETEEEVELGYFYQGEYYLWGE